MYLLVQCRQNEYNEVLATLSLVWQAVNQDSLCSGFCHISGHIEKQTILVYLLDEYGKGCAPRTISSAHGRCSNTLVFFYFFLSNKYLPSITTFPGCSGAILTSIIRVHVSSLYSGQVNCVKL